MKKSLEANIQRKREVSPQKEIFDTKKFEKEAETDGKSPELENLQVIKSNEKFVVVVETLLGEIKKKGRRKK